MVQELSKLHEHYRHVGWLSPLSVPVDRCANHPGARQGALGEATSWDGGSILVSIGKDPQEGLVGCALPHVGQVIAASSDGAILLLRSISPCQADLWIATIQVKFEALVLEDARAWRSQAGISQISMAACR